MDSPSDVAAFLGVTLAILAVPLAAVGVHLLLALLGGDAGRRLDRARKARLPSAASAGDEGVPGVGEMKVS